MTDGVKSFVRQVGSWSWLAKPIVGQRRREKNPRNWSLLLAAASDWASIRGVPKGSGQGSRATATIIILGRTPGVLWSLLLTQTYINGLKLNSLSDGPSDLIHSK